MERPQDLGRKTQIFCDILWHVESMLSFSMKFLVDLVRWWRSVTMAVSCFFTYKIVLLLYIYMYSYKGGINLLDKRLLYHSTRMPNAWRKKNSENKNNLMFVCECLPTRTLWKPGIEHTAQRGNTVCSSLRKDVLMKASRKTGWWPTSWGKGRSSRYLLQGFIYPRWCRISEPSIVSKYVFIFTPNLGEDEAIF